MPWKLITDAASEPVSTAEAKTHLRVDGSDEDAYIDTLVASATRFCQRYTNRQFIDATYELSLTEFPAGDFIELPWSPLSSITSVKYYDTSDVQQTWASSNYEAYDYPEPGQIHLAEGISWPSVDDRADAIQIRYVSGYGTASTDVPDGLLHAVKLLVGYWFDNREPVTTGVGFGVSLPAPRAVYDLLDMYKLPEFV